MCGQRVSLRIHTRNHNTHLRDSVTLLGVICARRRSVGGFYRPLCSWLTVPGKALVSFDQILSHSPVARFL